MDTLIPVTEEISPDPLLNEEQSSAHSAVIDFCWNLQLAIGRRPSDPELSVASKAIVTDLLRRDAEELLAQGEALWNTWIISGGHQKHPAIFTKENMLFFLSQVNKVRIHEKMMQEYHATVTNRLSTT